MASDFRDTPYGPIASDYEVAPLGELCVPDGGVQTGPFGSQLHSSDYMEYGTPIITVEHLGDNRIIHRDLPCVSEEDRDRLAKFALKTDDIVFSRVGSVDRRAIVHPEEDGWLFSGRCLRVRPNIERINAGYLSWFFGLPGFKEHIRKIAVGATMPSLNTTILSNVPIYFPPQISEQRAIAAILGALDDKIELNRRMNATLEGIARALFKSWFVDFDPVRAKAEGRRMKDEIAALFPDALVDSELGEIPRGWRVTNLGKQVNAAKGLSYKGEHLCHEGEGLPLHNLNSVYEGGGYKFEGMKWYSGEYKERHLLEPGDVIVTNTEQGFEFLLIGYAAIVPKHFGPKGLFSHHIYRLRPRKDSYLPPWFFYLLLRTSHFHQIVAGYSNGTTVNMLPADGMQKPQFVLPPKALIEQFDRLFTPVAARIETIYEESRTLAALRDTLLPKLLSGELRVPDAERLCTEGGL